MAPSLFPAFRKRVFEVSYLSRQPVHACHPEICRCTSCANIEVLFKEVGLRSRKLVNGEPVEEFEMQFIDGEHIDCELAKAFGVSQANIASYFEVSVDWDDDQKIRYIIAVGECGYAFDSDPDRLDIDIYEVDSLKELAEQFVEEGLFGDIPDRISCYLDYDLIARDLGCDYTETEIAGRRIVYRCG